MNKAIPILALALVILVAGCVSGGGDGDVPTSISFPGVAFSSFYPISTTVNAGGQATLYFSVQNGGYFDAENVEVTIFNCGSINGRNPADYDTKTGKLSDGTTLYACNDEIVVAAILDKPDRDLGIPGEISEEQITFTVPSTGFPAGRSPSTFSGRVEYDYKSSAARDVVFTTFQNWREKGGNIEIGALTRMRDPAPLSVDLIAPSDPIIITDTELPTFTVSVDIKNLGGGYVEDNELKEIKLCYDSTFVKVENEEDFGHDDGNCVYIDKTGSTSDTKQKKLKLVGQTNQWRTVDAKFTLIDGKVTVQDIAGFSVELSYTYHQDTTTQITVLSS